MYLRSLKIKNYRKFGDKNNNIEFVGSKGFKEKNYTIAPATTLIVGKNNSGKTTVTKALDTSINNRNIKSNDFNFQYLNSLLTKYLKDDFKDLPVLEFQIKFAVDKNSNDLVSNIIKFMKIGDFQDDEGQMELEVILKYEVKEDNIFKTEMKSIIDKYNEENEEPNNYNYQTLFSTFLKILDDTDFQLNYYRFDSELITDSNFKINKLIDIKNITANKSLTDTCLSKTFNKIIKYRYQSNTDSKHFNDLENEIGNINQKVTQQIAVAHTGSINDVLNKIESSNRLNVNLSSDLTFEKLMSSLIKYEYSEGNYNIPENQFGLGYSNLMAIIGELIDYIEKYSDDDYHSRINLICIEEPEAFMHPQMQELFIKHIDDALSYLLQNTEKEINSQLIITTHSSHILNSKIHSGNTFNNITYITDSDRYSCVVNLDDEKIMNEKREGEREEDYNKRKIEELKFLKKHIKYKVSELFFSDAVIFVEGVTEETVLSYFIDINENLNKYYISIFNIDGAHGHIYHPLIRLLKVPTIVITDLDIKREPHEKEKFIQIDKLNGRKTTNNTIIKYNKDNDISDIEEYILKGNLYITFQSKINKYYPTSFEEALILNNYNTDILHNVLKSIKPVIYSGIVGEEINKHNLKDQSYKLQKKLSKSKSDFANRLLYELIINDNEKESFKLPEYISNSLNWLNEQLSGGNVG